MPAEIFKLLILIVVIMLIGCQEQLLPHSELLGKWKSSEKLTLESMNTVEGVSTAARELFENDFFGDLVVEYKESEYRAINAKDEYDSGFLPYQVHEITDEYILTNEWIELLEEYKESKIYFEDDCYYVLTSKFNFREYFCRYE
jgi:hypothetical protein